MTNYIDDVALAIWEELSPEDRGDEIDWPLYRKYALLALTVGTDCNMEAIHDAWSAWCANVQPGHRSLVPYALLSEDVQMKDEPYLIAVLNVAWRLKENLKSRHKQEVEVA